MTDLNIEHYLKDRAEQKEKQREKSNKPQEAERTPQHTSHPHDCHFITLVTVLELRYSFTVTVPNPITAIVCYCSSCVLFYSHSLSECYSLLLFCLLLCAVIFVRSSVTVISVHYSVIVITVCYLIIAIIVDCFVHHSVFVLPTSYFAVVIVLCCSVIVIIV